MPMKCWQSLESSKLNAGKVNKQRKKSKKNQSLKMYYISKKIIFDLRGLNGGFLLLRNFSVTISVSPHVCFILVYGGDNH